MDLALTESKKENATLVVYTFKPYHYKGQGYSNQSLFKTGVKSKTLYYVSSWGSKCENFSETKFELTSYSFKKHHPLSGNQVNFLKKHPKYYYFIFDLSFWYQKQTLLIPD